MSRARYSEEVVRQMLSVYLILVLAPCISGVIVDGSKKTDISATKHQSPARDLVDPFNTKTCGIADSNKDEHEFVNMAREGQFPWIVSFQIKVSQHPSLEEQRAQARATHQNSSLKSVRHRDDIHFCCGSIVGEKWILSAAHCFEPALIQRYLKDGRINVVAGSHKVLAREPINSNHSIARVYLHAKFDSSMPVGFDIALVELDKPLKLTEKRETTGFGEQSKPYMNSICLPLKNHTTKFNESARIAGWGLSSENDETSMPSKLLVTDILINKTDSCAEDYTRSLKSTRPKEQLLKYNDFLCANYKQTRDACQSDSGGPMMQFADGKAVVTGIVSYGLGCATKGVPGIYIRTAAYLNWIRDIVEHGKKARTSFKAIDRSATKNSEPGLARTTPAPSFHGSMAGSKSPTVATTKKSAKRGAFKFLGSLVG